MGFYNTSGAGKSTFIKIVKNKLNRVVDNYCGEITNGKNKVLQKRHIINKKTKKKIDKNVKKEKIVLDFPAMAAACTSFRMPEVIVKKHSCSMPANTVHPIYDNAIKTQGFELGKSTNICTYKIGRCAEQNAGNKLLNKDSKIKNLDEIYFSQAVRPRTRQVFEYCDNCKTIFPTLK